MKWAFFGLTPKYKQDLHSTIFLLLYKVPGFTHDDLYNMPIWLRIYYLKEYKEWKKAENENASGQESADQGQEAAYQQYLKTRQNNPS